MSMTIYQNSSLACRYLWWLFIGRKPRGQMWFRVTRTYEASSSGNLHWPGWFIRTQGLENLLRTCLSWLLDAVESKSLDRRKWLVTGMHLIHLLVFLGINLVPRSFRPCLFLKSTPVGYTACLVGWDFGGVRTQEHTPHGSSAGSGKNSNLSISARGGFFGVLCHSFFEWWHMKSPTSDGSDPVRVSSLLLACYLYNVCYAEDRTLIDSHPHIPINLSANEENLHSIHKAIQFHTLDPRLLGTKQTARRRAYKSDFSVEYLGWQPQGCGARVTQRTRLQNKQSSDIAWCGFAQISALSNQLS